MTVQTILSALRRNYINHKYHLNNAYIFRHDWESDFFSMSDSGYFYECEIKMSRADYFNDFKKNKHGIFRAINITKKLGEDKIPHRFLFVCPEGLIKPDEVPDYAGLLYVVDRGTEVSCIIRQVKSPPFIHKNIFDINRRLLDKYYFRAEKLRFDLYEANQEIKKLKKQLDDRDNTIQGKELPEISS